ncbi:hypothetical protein F4824DRAFT_486168 [Ustulina deusta]|nr:hypothetical protein F4824DRAFT_486168 [Ustulina deusta]
MAHSIQTSRLSPPPADLRPAPLRIPLRKTVAGFEDGSGTAVAKGKVSGRDTSTSTSFQRDSGRHTKSDIPHTLPEQRDPRSKLESLVSRFEILDAVNSADTSVPQYLNNSYRARPSTILRATGSKRSLSQDPFSHSPTESISRASSELSPRQIRTPGAFSSRSPFSTSTIPVLRHSRLFITSKETAPSSLPESKPSIAQDGGSCSQPLLFGKGKTVHVRPRSNATELPSSQDSVGGTVDHDASLSLSRSGQSSLRETGQEETNILHGPMKLKPLIQIGNARIRQESEINTSLDALPDGLGSVPFGEYQRDGALAETPKVVECEEPGTKDTSVRGLTIPTALSPGYRPTQGGGKVSQLRRFFERSTKRLYSPLSLMNFRSIPELEECSGALMGDYSSSSWNESASPRSTHTIARRISVVPSLTTEISVNDFFCDFVGSPNYEESQITASPSQTAAKAGSQMKHESPVKNRIQLFEHLSRDSLKVGANTEHYGRHTDTGLQSVFGNDNRVSGKRHTVRNWRPIHKKGAAIWRNISNSLSRSLESWKDCNSGHEQIAEGTSLNTSPCHSTSPANDPRRGLHHFSPFGYSMHRVTHTSRQFVTPSHTASSIQLGDRDTPIKAPRGILNGINSCSSPDTPPPLVVRKSLPIFGRVSSGFRRPGGLGLDGHFPSKPVREEDFRPSDGTTSGPSTPQGDPDALLKVMLKQSAAERSRRREDEKHVRRDKKLRALAIWKGKGKAEHSANNTGPGEEASKKQEKGKWKGKEKEIPRKENEGQSSTGQESETNKKTASGFVVFESKDVKLRHPKPRRPGQVRKLANMYKDKGSSGASINTKASSGATLKESRQSFRQKASSALGLRGRKGDGTAG